MSVTGMEQVQSLLEAIGQYFSRGAQVDLSNASSKVAEQAREAIKAGQDTNGKALPPLKKATLEGPVKRDGADTPRSFYGSTPLSATDKTANSIVSKKSGTNEWEIASSTDLGDAILYSNAKQNHSGRPFGGDTPKVNRDPLQVSDKQMDLIENALLKGIDEALNG